MRRKRIGDDKEGCNVEGQGFDKRRSAGDPLYGEDTDDYYVEIRFETQSDANVAVEQLNELFKKATGLVFSSENVGR